MKSVWVVLKVKDQDVEALKVTDSFEAAKAYIETLKQLNLPCDAGYELIVKPSFYYQR